MPAPAADNRLATPALALAIVGAMISIWSIVPLRGIIASVFALPLAVAAIVLGHVSLAREVTATARVALILGYAAFVISVGFPIWRFVTAVE